MKSGRLFVVLHMATLTTFFTNSAALRTLLVYKNRGQFKRCTNLANLCGVALRRVRWSDAWHAKMVM